MILPKDIVSDADYLIWRADELWKRCQPAFSYGEEVDLPGLERQRLDALLIKCRRAYRLINKHAERAKELDNWDLPISERRICIRKGMKAVAKMELVASELLLQVRQESLPLFD